MMKVAIIDTGIDVSHPRLRDISISGVVFYNLDGKWHYDDDFHDTIGHGTGCASIIVKHSPHIELVGIKIFHENFITNEEYLIEGLRWVANHPDIKVVNVSLGSTGSANASLAKICQELYNKGCAIVAACNNNIDKIDYPAALPSVFGVLAGQQKQGLKYGTKNGYYIAKGSIQRVASINKREIITSGTSFATSHMVGIIANVMQNHPPFTMTDLRRLLDNNASGDISPIQYLDSKTFHKKPRIISSRLRQRIVSQLTPQSHLKWLGKIAIFPASEKEMKQFFDFPHLSIAKIAMKFDYPRTFSTMSSAGMRSDEKQELPSQDELATFDTLVIGYFYDNLWEGNIHFGNTLIDKCIFSGKHIFAYDIRVAKYAQKRMREIGLGRSSHVYTPTISNKTHDLFSCCEILPNVKCPVLLVVGTGNKQGKFTTQLSIKEILSTEGYNTAFISTEPHGELFGANIVYSYGYRSTVSLLPTERLIFLRNLGKGLSYYGKPDIIISGTQGAVIPETPLSSVPYLGTVDAITIVYGLLPDIVVCAINPDDTVEYINSIITAVSLYSKGQIAFFVITPWVQSPTTNSKVRLQPSVLAQRIEYYEQRLNKPVIDIMDHSNNGKVLEIIENICS